MKNFPKTKKVLKDSNDKLLTAERITSGLGKVAELIDSGCESQDIILNQSTTEFL